MKKISVFMMEVGGGHKMPAISVIDELKELRDDLDIKIYDVARDLGASFYDKSVKFWWKYMLKFPLLLSFLYKITENNHKLVQNAQAILEKEVEKKFIEFLEKEKPDLVFSTHCTAANILGRLKSKGLFTDIIDVLFITDAFEVHPIWIQGNSNFYIFCDAKPLLKLKDWGIKEDKFKIMNFPLRKQFTEDYIKRLNKSKILSELNLEEKFTVLLLAGGEGIGKIENQISEIFKNRLDINVLAITGRNRKMYNRLKALKQKMVKNGIKIYNNLKIFGFVKNMVEILFVSDLVLTKAGLSSTLEALYLKKPVILTQCMENEKGLKDFVLNNGCGWFYKDVGSQVDQIKKILLNRKIYDDTVKNIQSLKIKNGSREIAEFLISLI